MNQALAADIERYFGYFRAQLRFLSDLPDLVDGSKLIAEYGIQPIPNLRLLNACTHIEAIGHVVPPRTCGSQARFVSTLTKYSGASEWGLVSLAELWRAVRNPERARNATVRKCLAEVRDTLADPIELPNVDSEIVAAARIDSDIASTRGLLQRRGFVMSDAWDRLLKDFTIASVLYRDYRCGLAHEARRLATGWDFATAQVPYYHDLLSKDPPPNPEDDDATEACLVIPDAFVLASLAGCIRSIEAYCVGEEVNPYDLTE